MTVPRISGLEISGTPGLLSGPGCPPLTLPDGAVVALVDRNKVYYKAAAADTFTLLTNTGTLIPQEQISTATDTHVSPAAWRLAGPRTIHLWTMDDRFPTTPRYRTNRNVGVINAAGTEIAWTVNSLVSNTSYLSYSTTYLWPLGAFIIPEAGGVETFIMMVSLSGNQVFGWDGVQVRRLGAIPGIAHVGSTSGTWNHDGVGGATAPPRRAVLAWRGADGLSFVWRSATLPTSGSGSVGSPALRTLLTGFTATNVNLTGIAYDGSTFWIAVAGTGLPGFGSESRVYLLRHGDDPFNPVDPATVAQSIVLPSRISALSQVAGLFLARLSDGELVLLVWARLGGDSDGIPLWVTNYDPATNRFDSWTPLTGTWGSAALLKDIQCQRHDENGILNVQVRANGTAHWFRLGYNDPPHKPNLVRPLGGVAYNVNDPLTLAWTFSDPDNDTQGSYEVRRTIGSTVTYWDGDSWETANQQVDSDLADLELAANWGARADGDHQYAVRLWDHFGNGPSPWSDDVTITPTVPVNPTIGGPTDGQTVYLDEVDVTWAVAEQTAYRIRVLGVTAGTTDIDLGSVLYDTGKQAVAATRTLTIPLSRDGQSLWIELVTWNDDDYPSDPQRVRVVTDWQEPNMPAVPTITVDTVREILAVALSSPAPTGNTPRPRRLELQRRVTPTGDGETVAIVAATQGSGTDPDVGQYLDWFVAHLTDYGYRCRGIAGRQIAGPWSVWRH